jgi:8-oxo-dGTP pyrophosphatase MutT (NUDIX family)
MVRIDSSSNSVEEAVVPRPAATVMLVRDGLDGVEVFLMKRSGFGMFGGLHVFPGGKVDGADRAAAGAAFAKGPNDARSSEILGLASGGLDYWVACIRECFEEAGVLLATDADGTPLQLVAPEMRRRFGRWRDRLNAREPGVLEAMCAEEGLQLATDQLAYVSHWITPVDQPTRFDTRFFVARAPSEQSALHDGHETVHSEWIRPEFALERFADGELNLISPTENNLKALVDFDSTERLLEAKRKIDPRSIPTIVPRIQRRNSAEFDEVLEIVGHGGKLSGP